jgi:hypothetical protein
VNVYFSFVGVEKKNDDYRKFFHHSINRWNPCKSLVCVEKRQGGLEELGRTPRTYRKRNASFWFEGGKADLAKSIQRSMLATVPSTQDSFPQQIPQLPYTLSDLKKMTMSQLKNIIMEELEGSTRKKPRKSELVNSIQESATLLQESG